MKWFRNVFWASVRGLSGAFLAMVLVLVLIALCGCDRGLRKENERLREELARQQQWVPLQRDTIRDTVEVVRQQVVEVERIREVLTADDKALLKDLGTRVDDLESYQKLSTQTEASVTLHGSDAASHGQSDSKSDSGRDSVLIYKDAWLDLKYNQENNNLSVQCKDSMAIAVEKEYRKKFLWWRWGVKGYEVKAVSFSPYTTIRYNTFVKRKK